MIKAVFDTSVLYSAISKSTSVPATVFDLVTAGLIIPCVSDAVMVEYKSVLRRPELYVHAQRVERVLEILSSVALHVAPSAILNVSNHEPDNRFYECADAAAADYIVTGNLKHFPKPYRVTQIVTPRQLLTLVTVIKEKE